MSQGDEKAAKMSEDDNTMTKADITTSASFTDSNQAALAPGPTPTPHIFGAPTKIKRK